MFYCKYVCFEYFEGTSSNSLVSKEKIFFKLLTDISWPKVILRRLDLRVDCGSVEPLGRVPSPISDLQKPKENWKNLSPNFCTSITMQNLTNFSPTFFLYHDAAYSWNATFSEVTLETLFEIPLPPNYLNLSLLEGNGGCYWNL